MNPAKWFGCFAVGVVVILGTGARGQPRAPEQLAAAKYEMGMKFLRDGNHVEALREFQDVIDDFPDSAVRKDALLELARYHLDVAGDVTVAQEILDRVIREYATTEAYPRALLLRGRVKLIRDLPTGDIKPALADFERVAGYFDRIEAVPEALYRAGEALRLVHQHEAALERFRQVASRYTQSEWAALARLRGGMSLVVTGEPHQAFGLWQGLIDRAPAELEAKRAMAYNRVLSRLYLGWPAYTLDEALGAGLQDARVLALDPQDRLYVGARDGVRTLDETRAVGRPIAADDLHSIVFDSRGTPVLGERRAIWYNGTRRRLEISGRQLENITSVVQLSTGERVVADDGQRIVARFSPENTFVARLSGREFRDARLAVSEYDDIAVLDRGSNTVTIFQRRGTPAGEIRQRGTGYELRRPVEIAFGPLSHLYVLDRDGRAVLAFTLKGRFIAKLPLDGQGRVVERPSTFAIDSTAALYVYDERNRRIHIYR